MLRERPGSPATSEQVKQKKRVLRVSRAKKESGEAETVEHTGDDVKHRDGERKEGSPRNRRRLRHHTTEKEQKEPAGHGEEDLGTKRSPESRRRVAHREQQAERKVDRGKRESTHRRGKEEVGVTKSERPRIDAAKPNIDHSTREKRRTTSHRQDETSHDDRPRQRGHTGVISHQSGTDANRAAHDARKDRKSARAAEDGHTQAESSEIKSSNTGAPARNRIGSSHGKEEHHSHIRGRKSSQNKEEGHSGTRARVGDKEENHSYIRSRKASENKEEGHSNTKSKAGDSHMHTREKKVTHGRDSEFRSRAASNEVTDKRKVFSSKGRSATVATAPADEKRKDFKQRTTSFTHNAPHSKPR